MTEEQYLALSQKIEGIDRSLRAIAELAVGVAEVITREQLSDDDDARVKVPLRGAVERARGILADR